VGNFFVGNNFQSFFAFFREKFMIQCCSEERSDKMIRLWYEKIKETGDLLFSYPVSAFAAQTTFFFIISAFPFVMLLITLIGYIPGIEEQMLQSEISRIMPQQFHPFLDKVFNEIYKRQSITLISVVAISTLFAASKGFTSLIRGMNLVYSIKEKRNYFVVRGMAALCTLVMMAAIVITLLLMVFGDKLLSVILLYLPVFAKPAILLVSFRAILIFVLLTTLFLLLYLFVPSRSSNIRSELPGAMLAAGGWILFSFLYACYLEYMTTYIYGSLTAAVFIMLWMYFCIYILFVGAEINQYLRLKGEMKNVSGNKHS
jgi:membrane protein